VYSIACCALDVGRPITLMTLFVCASTPHRPWTKLLRCRRIKCARSIHASYARRCFEPRGSLAATWPANSSSLAFRLSTSTVFVRLAILVPPSTHTRQRPRLTSRRENSNSMCPSRDAASLSNASRRAQRSPAVSSLIVNIGLNRKQRRWTGRRTFTNTRCSATLCQGPLQTTCQIGLPVQLWSPCKAIARAPGRRNACTRLPLHRAKPFMHYFASGSRLCTHPLMDGRGTLSLTLRPCWRAP
jgi:hypothetical protein